MEPPELDRNFNWNTPASRKLIRAVAKYAMACNYRDSIDELGPVAVAANRNQFAARKSMDQALSKLLSEIREDADFLQISSRPQPRL